MEIRTFPICPCCNGNKTIPRDVCNGRRLEKVPCYICNGNGAVSLETFNRYLKDNDENGTECFKGEKGDYNE